MPVYEDSRYASSTEIIEVTIDPISGKKSNPVRYLDEDRKQFNPIDFKDNITFTPPRGATPDMIANHLYGNSTLAWLVGEFNDTVGFDMFRTFDGIEQITMPSPSSVFTQILGAD
jgi:hypothetical protein